MGHKTLYKTFVISLMVVFINILGFLFSPSAEALTPIKITDVNYHDCPPELAKGAVTSGGVSQVASCFIVTGKAINSSRKPVYNADVFGRIYDANGDSVMQNRTRIGSIEEVPVGESEFGFRISVPANQPTPLQLEQFKATGFAGTVRR